MKSQLTELCHEYEQDRQEALHQQKTQKMMKWGKLILMVVALLALILLFSHIMHKKQQHYLKEQQKETEERLEAERQIHHTEQSALSGRLKRSNEELRELKDQIKEQQKVEAMPKPQPEGLTFTEEPICRIIMERASEGQFKSKVNCLDYKDFALDKTQLHALREAVDSHFNQFTRRLARSYPALSKSDLDYCCLYLLGLTDADIAALIQRSYSTVNERSSKLKYIFECENALSTTLLDIANETID